MNFIQWLEQNNHVIEVPIGNVWIMHHSVNPYKNSTLQYHRQNPNFGFPSGRIGTGNEEEFGAWVRLVDDEEFDPYGEDNIPVVNQSIPIDPNHPRVFLDDGTHRAIVVHERGDKTMKVKITN